MISIAFFSLAFLAVTIAPLFYRYGLTLSPCEMFVQEKKIDFAHEERKKGIRDVELYKDLIYFEKLMKQRVSIMPLYRCLDLLWLYRQTAPDRPWLLTLVDFWPSDNERRIRDAVRDLR